VSTVEAVWCKEFATNRPPERIRVHTSRNLAGVEFWSVSDSMRRWSMHHDTFTATLLLGSSFEVKWHSRGCSRAAGPGSVQLMEPGEVHRTIQVSQPVSLFMICWTPAALERTAAKLRVDGMPRFTRPQVDDPGLARALQALQSSVCAAHDELDIEAAYDDSTRRLLELGAQPPACPTSSRFRHPRVRRAVEYLHEFFADTIPLAALASQANLSKFYFARSFRAMTGFAPHQYQTLLRLQAARRLLEAGASVEAAADEAGFADAPHLTRTFGEWLGVSPGAWARRGRSSDPPPRAQLDPGPGSPPPGTPPSAGRSKDFALVRGAPLGA